MADAEDASTKEELERFAQLESEHFKLLSERARRQRKQKTQVALTTALVSIMGIATIAFSLFDQKSRSGFDATGLIAELFKAQEAVRVPDFEKAKAELLESLKSTLEQSGERYNVSSDNLVMAGEVAQLSARLDLIEKSISTNPERALSIPLLRRDQDELSRKLEEYRVSAKAESDRLWGQQNTILQGIGALLLAVAAGAITILYRAIKPEEQKLPS